MYPHVERNRYDPLTSPVVSTKRSPALLAPSSSVGQGAPPVNFFAPVNAAWAHAQAPTVAQLQDARRREQEAAEEAFHCPSFSHNRLCPWCGSFCHEDHLVHCEKRLMHCPICKSLVLAKNGVKHYQSCQDLVLKVATERAMEKLLEIRRLEEADAARRREEEERIRAAEEAEAQRLRALQMQKKKQSIRDLFFSGISERDSYEKEANPALTWSSGGAASTKAGAAATAAGEPQDLNSSFRVIGGAGSSPNAAAKNAAARRSVSFPKQLIVQNVPPHQTNLMSPRSALAASTSSFAAQNSPKATPQHHVDVEPVRDVNTTVQYYNSRSDLKRDQHHNNNNNDYNAAASLGGSQSFHFPPTADVATAPPSQRHEELSAAASNVAAMRRRMSGVGPMVDSDGEDSERGGAAATAGGSALAALSRRASTVAGRSSNQLTASHPPAAAAATDEEVVLAGPVISALQSSLRLRQSQQLSAEDASTQPFTTTTEAVVLERQRSARRSSETAVDPMNSSIRDGGEEPSPTHGGGMVGMAVVSPHPNASFRGDHHTTATTTPSTSSPKFQNLPRANTVHMLYGGSGGGASSVGGRQSSPPVMSPQPSSPALTAARRGTMPVAPTMLPLGSYGSTAAPPSSGPPPGRGPTTSPRANQDAAGPLMSPAAPSFLKQPPRSLPSGKHLTSAASAAALKAPPLPSRAQRASVAPEPAPEIAAPPPPPPPQPAAAPPPPPPVEQRECKWCKLMTPPEHEKKCAYRTVVCKRCTQTMKMKERSAHQEVCPNRPGQ